MAGYQLLLLMLCALGLVLESRAECTLTRAMVEGTNRLFTYRNAAGQYDLKRTLRVREGEVLHMICQPNDIIQTTCQRNGRFSRSLPMHCTNPMFPGATVVTDNTCGQTMYSIGYTINNHRMELYRACYDRTNVRAHFTVHSVYAKSFYPRRPCTQFTRDGVLTEADANSFLTRNIFRTFRRLFGNRQTYIPNDRTVVINRGHLAPSADFLFGDQMCATFKYVNVVPQFKAINDGNWETIERWVRNQITGEARLNIKTGTVGTLSLNQTPTRRRQVILGTATKNPVPEWMYKRVRTATNQPLAIFVTYNNIYATRRPPAPSICNSVPCPVTLVDTARAGYTYCCNTTTFPL
ncbi:uncharacterized protein Dwil_GK10991 [Drosophila willistoni]|uniref:DNA/RNA non-specific endonuclease/pyrophosphatase/phosphodiesterase domain-containing protein n=1 Tax=Drosophila willistoni TaxID=7260 RepID=B4N8P8_DROWI|nr:uncharacterized protein LOC6646880 [Drosophila willistoni]EDW81499.1 uncharacterized protein Dwil_GK10991 [Drosophila willistoni]